MPALNAKDAALQRACPVISAPLFQPLPPMEDGQRIVIAANGVFIQVKRPWLDCIERIGDIDPKLPLPFGRLAPMVAFAFKSIPLALLHEFVAAGRRALPNEIAGGLIYAAGTGGLRLQIYTPLSQSPSGIHYAMPELAADEVIAVDLHTHGAGSAFFSAEDDRDDRGIKVAGVFGNLDAEQPSAAFRLAINGMYRPLPHPWQHGAQPVATAPAWPTLASLGFLGRQSWSM